ncbi:MULTISPECIES: DUF2993 domain-containing protein [unclassified Gordonia (in: high G+C Gram-positive bacteria)]|uniref:DUF2993 domain-containing protein n=1 Tax=unclassified Gordonia (in: high G+C Gram-positive bacteria) TaxID=2657482 RepID=UPI0010F662B9|nr:MULTISPECIES: DUF2993 domain-containing protein [unclassified Gordonia (in: high G+C Gram-positive bacteria)]
MSDSNTPRPDSSSGDPADATGKHDPNTNNPGDPDPATGEPTSTGQGGEWRPVSGTEQGEPPATEQFATEPIVPGAQAYSAIPPSDADTGAIGGAKPPTSQFAPGEDPYGPGTTASGPIPPGSPDGTGSGPVLTSPRKKRSTRKIVAFSVVGVLLLAVIAAVGSELYLRNKVTNCLEESFSGLTGVPTEVSLSRKPILLQGSGDIPFVQVDTDDSAGGVRLHMRADGISGTENSTDIQSLDGTGFIPYERIVELSKEQAGASGQSTGTPTGGVGAVEQITGNAADGTFEVQAAFPVMVFQVPVSATVKPVLNDGRVDFEVVKASALVFGIPPDFAQQIVDQITTSSLGPFFDEVQVDSLEVTDSGLEFAISGSDVQLTSEMTGTSSQSQSGGCSV